AADERVLPVPRAQLGGTGEARGVEVDSLVARERHGRALDAEQGIRSGAGQGGVGERHRRCDLGDVEEIAAGSSVDGVVASVGLDDVLAWATLEVIAALRPAEETRAAENIRPETP